MVIQAKRFSGLTILAAACVLVCVATAIYPNKNATVSQILFGVAIATPLLAIPFLVLLHFGRKVVSPLFGGLFYAGMLAALGWWCFVFWESFLVPENSDPQNGLVFFFGPLYSAIAAAVAGKALVLLDARWNLPR